MSGQTCIDFAREKGILFDRWCSMCRTEDLASVQKLMLEEFKISVSEQVTDPAQAATSAD